MLLLKRRFEEMILSRNLFKWKHYEKEIILLCVRWYLKYQLSYRDLEGMMAERGIIIAHMTIMRWIQQYAPIIDEKIRKYLKKTNDLWRLDETYIKILHPLNTVGVGTSPKITKLFYCLHHRNIFCNLDRHLFTLYPLPYSDISLLLRLSTVWVPYSAFPF